MAAPGDDVGQQGLVEFLVKPCCPNGCPDPSFEVELLQGMTYLFSPDGEWVLRDTLDIAVLLYARCAECGHVLVDRSLEEAVAIELAPSRADRIARGKKPDTPRRRFALQRYKETTHVEDGSIQVQARDGGDRG